MRQSQRKSLAKKQPSVNRPVHQVRPPLCRRQGLLHYLLAAGQPNSSSPCTRDKWQAISLSSSTICDFSMCCQACVSAKCSWQGAHQQIGQGLFCVQASALPTCMAATMGMSSIRGFSVMRILPFSVIFSTPTCNVPLHMHCKNTAGMLQGSMLLSLLLLCICCNRT